MEPKEFLDYLVSIGLGSKEIISLRDDYPGFPYNNSIHIPKDTTFFTNKIKYRFEIPIAVSDNTRVITTIPYPGGTVKTHDLLDQVIAFLKYLANWRQPYGITFYSPTWGNKNYDPSPYRPKYHGGYVNIDFMLPAMGAFGGIAEGLDIAWAIKYLTDFMAELGWISNSSDIEKKELNEKQVESNENIGKNEKIITKKKEDINKKENTSTTRPQYPQSNNDIKYVEDTTIVSREIKFNVLLDSEPMIRDSIYYHSAGQWVKFINIPGDTLSSYEEIKRASGKVDWENHTFYPSTHVSYEKESPIMKTIRGSKKKYE